MMAARRTPQVRALASLPAVAALACAGLTACGSTAAARDASTTERPATSAPVNMTVCAHASDVDRLTIGRVNLLPQNHEHFSFPAQVTVTRARQAQAVARALCALPMFPSGPMPMNCPVDLGISYALTFTVGDSKLAPVTVEATGCQQVRGLGPALRRSPPRWTTGSPAFWRVLATAAGITPADHATFTGTFASRPGPGCTSCVDPGGPAAPVTATPPRSPAAGGPPPQG